MAVRLKLKAGGTGIEICTAGFRRHLKEYWSAGEFNKTAARSSRGVGAGELTRASSVVRACRRSVIAEGRIELPSPDYQQ
jgi:hypothetical protein